MRKLLAVCVTVSLAISACDTDSNVNDCNFDEAAMLANYADELIIPRLEGLASATSDLQMAAIAFQTSPAPAELDALQAAFKEAYLEYQRCSSFTFGPGLIDGIPFRDRFNTFPTNTSFMETSIESGTEVTASPRSVVGFPALDYLLHGTESQTDQDVIELFSTGQNVSNRFDYLIGLCDELKMTSESIVNGWSNYRSSFVSNTGTAAGSSISMIGNEFNRDYEIMKNFKFKVPLGKLNGGVVLPDKVEGYYSGISAELATEQLQAIKDFYLGVAESGADGSGLADYLECLQTESDDKLLSEVITDRFQVTLDQLSQVPDPMSETLMSNKPVVDQTYTEMQMTVPKIKRDMTAAFGVQINYDSGDGD